MDETLLYLYDTETNQQSMEWWHSCSSRSKFKSECKNSVEKFVASIFRDQDGILIIDYLPKGQIIKAECYPSLLVPL